MFDFAKSQIFRAYDIRGIYPKEVNEEIFYQLGLALPKILKVKILVGRDTRLSSPSLYRSVLRGLNHYLNYSNVLKNIRIVSLGIVTTPMLYFLVNQLKAGGGIMVTASHNPKEYNGLKVVGPKAKPISGKSIQKLLR